MKVSSKKELKKINVGVVMKRGESIHSRVCEGTRQKKTENEKKEVVYMIKCKTCEMPYIGETGQMFGKRRSQHQVRRKETTNGFFDHLKRNKRRVIDWKNCRFLEKEKNWFRRKVKESVIINTYNIRKKTKNIEKGVEIHSRWGTITSDENFARMIKKHDVWRDEEIA